MGQSTDKAGVAISPKLPREADAAFYGRINHDLHAHSDARLVEHFEAFGKKEGRVASPAGLRSDSLRLFRRSQKSSRSGRRTNPAWRTTPSSFREILETLHRLGKSPLRPLRVCDTPRGQNEFFAVLGRERG